MFTLFHLGGALGHNAATLLSTRMLAGIMASARMSIPFLFGAYNVLMTALGSVHKRRRYALGHVDRT